MTGERRMAKFSKKLLGRKIRTQMVMHRLVVKFYENGITIKPWKSQGEFYCPVQSEIFLTKENTKYLKNFLDVYSSAEEIANSLDVKDSKTKEAKEWG